VSWRLDNARTEPSFCLGKEAIRHNESIVRERIYLDKGDKTSSTTKSRPSTMTRPWTVDKAYGRETKVFWYVNLRGLRPTIGVQFGPSPFRL
jgi:hypothetical protein